METFAKGQPKYNTNHFKTFAEIHEIAEKPGWIGKKISFKYGVHGNWEQMKADVIESTQLIDKYLVAYVPKYYFTFEEGGNEESRNIVYFMEEVKENSILPPAKEVDSFLAVCWQMFFNTAAQGKSFIVDINKIENLIFGHTANNPNPKLYFIDFYPFYFSSSSYLKERLLQQLSEFAKIYGENSFPKTQALIPQLSKFSANG